MPWCYLLLILDGLVCRNQTWMALCLVSMFALDLRLGEPLRLQWTDVVAGPLFVALHLYPCERGEVSKVGMQDETMFLDSPYVAWLGPLLVDLQERQRHGPLFTFSYLELRRAVDETQLRLQLPELFILYQIRHGGASHDRENGLRALAEVKQRLRVASDSTVKRYEAHGRVQKLVNRLTPSQLRRAEQIAGGLENRIRSNLQVVKQGAYTRRR